VATLEAIICRISLALRGMLLTISLRSADSDGKRNPELGTRDCVTVRSAGGNPQRASHFHIRYLHSTVQPLSAIYGVRFSSNGCGVLDVPSSSSTNIIVATATVVAVAVAVVVVERGLGGMRCKLS
jgi:hypothetical protein